AAVGGFDEALATHEDWDLWLRLFIHGARFLRVDRPLARYWNSPGSRTKDARAMVQDAAVVRSRARAAGLALTDTRLFLTGLFWNAGVALACGDAADGLFDTARVEARDADACAQALFSGLAYGLGGQEQEVGAAWQRLEPRLLEALDGRRQSAMTPPVARQVLLALERHVVRTARFEGCLRLSSSLGVMIGPGLGRRLRQEAGGFSRVVFKAPWLRPRGLFMHSTDRFSRPAAPQTDLPQTNPQ
ncbi:MAG TPA: hypothetical protein VF459_01130, partial [Caulobacteraceae bacterium]